MDFVNLIIEDVAIVSNITIEEGINKGWLNIVQFHFDSAASGDIGLELRRSEDSVLQVIAALTVSSKGDAIWHGDQFLRAGDILRINNGTGVDCKVYITFTNENYQHGAWTEFAVGAGDESSSSSSIDSSSSSSSSSTSSSSSSSTSSDSSSSSSSISSNSSSSSSIDSSSSSSSSIDSSSSSSVDSSSSSSSSG